MPRQPIWVCSQINIKLHQISAEELKQRLAELWSVLVKERSQFHRSKVQELEKSMSPLLKSKRSAR